MTAAFVSVGRDSIAWTSSALFVDQHDRIRARMIVLGPTADVDTILAHARERAEHVAEIARRDAGPATYGQIAELIGLTRSMLAEVQRRG